MKFLSRVVWSEGMYLAPHHFQTQSRYVEDSIHFATSSLWYKPYGLAACELDHEALKNATVNLVHARGVFPDGLPFHLPESDDRPPARLISDAFLPTRDSHVLHLALPERRLSAPNFSLEANGLSAQTRYVSQTKVLRDETNGSDEKPVQVGRKNFRLLLDSELREGLMTLPVARIRRDGAGHFVYDNSFIPPCLALTASESLQMILRRLVEILNEKSRIMALSGRQSGQPLPDYFRRELANFWLLHTIHSSIGVLQHLEAKHGHPEELYVELARLGGALCSFSLETHPRDLPVYDHENLSECFAILDAHIRRHLELNLPVSCVTIPFTPKESYYWIAPIQDPRLIENSRWIIAVEARLGEAELIRRAPQRVKVCSDMFVRELVRRAVPGLTLTHLPAPPPEVPAKVEAQYFGLSKQGPCWDHIVKTKQVGVYVPGELPDPQMELHILVDK
jgi:type VI secretion system protein ImpJ